LLRFKLANMVCIVSVRLSCFVFAYNIVTPHLPVGAGVARGRTFGEAISGFKAGIASSGRRPPRND